MQQIAAALLLAIAAPPAPAAAQQPNFDNVQIRVERVAPGVAILFGRGGNIGLSYGADGNVIIDDQYAPLTGRILAAIGNSGATFDMAKTELYLASPSGGEVLLFSDGAPQNYDVAAAKACLAPSEVAIRVNLGLGSATATAWGSDLTEEFVRLNSQYTT